ncbi:MAG: hypothetical protein MPJ22_01445 [Pirellulales bacterium]|nr:hypothetical protein [Alphaproteobacteria bacterium]MDA8041076.1 hypothetical protein [Pirellulales bacterium]
MQPHPFIGKELADILCITTPAEYKVHLARFDDSIPDQKRKNPLQVFKESRRAWNNWNSNSSLWPPGNRLDRRYNISMVRTDSDKNRWLFCCVFEMLAAWDEEPNDQNEFHKKRRCYEIRTIDLGKKYRGLLEVSYDPGQREGSTHVYVDLEKVTNGLVVARVLPKPFQDWLWP